MKKFLTLLFSLALCAAVLAVPAAAALTPPAPEIEAAPQTLRLGPVQVWGAVTKLENGSLLLNNDDETDPNREIIVHTGSARLVDAVSGLPLAADSIRDGDIVYAWVGPAMMLSLPPQASAAVVVANLPADYAAPRYYQVAAAAPAADPSKPLTQVTVTATGGETLTITDQVELFPYLTKNVVGLPDLRPGAELLVWSDAEGAPVRAMLFPYAYRGYAAWTDTGAVTLNGEALSASGRTDAEGTVLLPIRAVAEALGLEVTWESGKGAVVRDNGTLVFTALPGGEPLLPSGDTGTYGICTIENGVTYLPAYCLLDLLNLFRAG